METEHGYRQEGLTIGRLAEQLGTQEYRLRRLINRRLGYRNFNEYLNDYRIREARALLVRCLDDFGALETSGRLPQRLQGQLPRIRRELQRCERELAGGGD